MNVFSEAINYLGTHLLQQLKIELGSEVDKKRVKWVLTVPAIWNDKAKFFMREAMYEVLPSLPSEALLAVLIGSCEACCQHCVVGLSVGRVYRHLKVNTVTATYDIVEVVVEGDTSGAYELK